MFPKTLLQLPLRILRKRTTLERVCQYGFATTVDAPQLPPFPHVPAVYDGPSAEELMKMRQAHFSSAIFHFYKKPLVIVEGKMQYMFDEHGKRYLDAIGGITTVSVGHCHPKVVAALEAQNKKLQHCSTIYLNPQTTMYAKELSERLPKGLDVVFFCNSGSEANELATLLARSYTGNTEMIALQNSYHGWTHVSMGLAGVGTWKLPGGGTCAGVHHVVNPDTYKGVLGPDVEGYLAMVDGLIEMGLHGRLAGFIAESIQGVGGCVTLLPGYLKEVYKRIKAAGGVCIVDEVQTGFGRTGGHYWGFQREGVVPDIVTMAKGMGNGLNLGAVVTTREIADSIKGKLFFNTFAGNPVVSAGGRAVLDIIDEEKLQSNCMSVGDAVMKGLKQLQKKHAVIGDVRGAGLMIGMELVKDIHTKQPATAELAQVFEHARGMGLLLGKGGLHGNVIRVKPPMCWNMEDVKFLLAVLDDGLSKL